MSWQTVAFQNLIELAKEGREDALPPLRRMIMAASQSATPEQLIKIAVTILEIGQEMSSAETEVN